ncbi:hypothetical protein BDV93DRAFT_560452 [Ceratobasidium sp. AG-I]|nr:hypothetical protein BDV93DRAFT_560452 [Ceratobasidium sp. AG-I]
MKSPLPPTTTASTSLKQQPIDEPLRQWNLARTNFATSLQIYLATFSHFELACSRFFDSKELDIARPDVRATFDEEILSLATYESSISPTIKRLLRLKNMSMVHSPIKRLPAEILTRIFMFAADSSWVVNTRPSRRTLPAIYINTIASVCSYWRQVALGTRQLWSRIDFKKLHYADYISLWLGRAGSCPLDVVDINTFGITRIDRDRFSAFYSMIPRIKCVRTMISDSNEQLMTRWISGWCANGAPRTLTMIALRTSSRGLVEFAVQGEHVNQQRLNELFHSLDTLYLCGLQVNWDSLRCHNLVTLSLLYSNITIDALRHVLVANANLQYIQLWSLNITSTPISAVPPPVQFLALHTLRLERFGYDNICDLLGMMIPGNHGLTLRIDHTDTQSLSDASRRHFIAFCRWSHITKLHCCSYEMLQDAIEAGSKLEILFFDKMKLNSDLYNLIAPPTSSEPLPPRLPHLHSLYFSGCEFKHTRGFKRIVSTCPIREVGIGRSCYTEGGQQCGIDDLKKWLGPEADVSFVTGKKELGYDPFVSH